MALAVMVQRSLSVVEVVAHGARETLSQPMDIKVLLKELLREEQAWTLWTGESYLAVHSLHMPCHLVTKHKLLVALGTLMRVHSCVCHPMPCEPWVAKALEVTVVALERAQQGKGTILVVDSITIMCQGYVTLQLALSGQPLATEFTLPTAFLAVDGPYVYVQRPL